MSLPRCHPIHGRDMKAQEEQRQLLDFPQRGKHWVALRGFNLLTVLILLPLSGRQERNLNRSRKRALALWWQEGSSGEMSQALGGRDPSYHSDHPTVPAGHTQGPCLASSWNKPVVSVQPLSVAATLHSHCSWAC